MSRFSAPISEQIWDMKYRLKEADGTPIDLTVEDTWRRVAKSLASVEDPVDSKYWEEVFYEQLEDFKFVPAGRINAGAGSDRNVTLFNCFVMGTVPDSLSGIMDMLKEAAITMQQGGGIGYDFSTIRPEGALVKGVAADASGPLTFMDVWDSTCRTIMSAGTRRGAMMATLRCDHPDVMKFIDAKRDPLRLRMFNMSVLVTDKFMEAVKNDEDFELVFDGKVYRTVKAKVLWDRIIASTYSYAEPGVIFIDRINKMNNLWYCEQIAATNPCGEQPLPPYGACLLGSINLTKFLGKGLGGYFFDWRSFEDTVSIAVRMLDNVVDVSKFPLEEQRKEAKDKRRIGLGYTGLADVMALLGIVYGSDDSVSFVDSLGKALAEVSYFQSASLATEKGVFPLYDRSKFLRSNSMLLMAEDPGLNNTLQAVASLGIRNALLTSIAPTGTISLYAGNVSSGIEPIFAKSYVRKVTQRDGTKVEEEVVDWAVSKFREDFPGEPLPTSFVTAQDLPPEAHLRVQGAAQKWIDSSISKTINVPEDITMSDFGDVYLRAWDLGCKGCTTYRPNDVTGSVLEATPEVEEGGACELRIDPSSGQLIRSCE